MCSAPLPAPPRPSPFAGRPGFAAEDHQGRGTPPPPSFSSGPGLHWATWLPLSGWPGDQEATHPPHTGPPAATHEAASAPRLSYFVRKLPETSPGESSSPRELRRGKIIPDQDNQLQLSPSSCTTMRRGSSRPASDTSELLVSEWGPQLPRLSPAQASPFKSGTQLPNALPHPLHQGSPSSCPPPCRLILDGFLRCSSLKLAILPS